MTLVTAIVVGLACGFFLGLRPIAFAIFAVVWVIVLIVQTTIVIDSDNLPPDDWAYVPVQIAIFALGLALIWLAARGRSRFAKRSDSN